MASYPKGVRSVRVKADVGGTVEAATLIHYQKTPSAPGAASVLAATALPASGTTTVTAGITQPDVPRNVSIVGNAAGITGNVVINGTNAGGATIQETIVANATTPVVGNKAFKTITSIVLPTRNAGGDTISVGRGSKLGLSHKLTRNTVFAKHTYYNNALEGTEPTVAISAANLENNTALLNTTLAGAVVDIYYAVP